MTRKLTVADIADARAYERVRAEHRVEIAALKARRRVALGTLVTVAFENRQTMRYQIQEMARAERIVTDAGIQDELDAYNPLIPEPGQLRATLFIELTSDEAVREWLARLVGIETHLLFRLADGTSVRCTVDPQHAGQLTRQHATAAVHYIGFELDAAQIEAFVDGTALMIDHPNYTEETVLAPSTLAELRADLIG